MKAGFAILADDRIQNFIRRLALELSQWYPIEFVASRNPAHISLKQPFAFESLDTLEAYFDSLSAQTPPIPIELPELYCEEWNGSGIIGLRVKENPILRALHNRLNQELKSICQDPTAPYDGAGYRFHMTVEMGKIGSTNPYREFFNQLTDTQVNLSFTAARLVLFYSHGNEQSPYIVYKTLPLSGIYRS